MAKPVTTAKKQPAAPEPLVDQVLRVARGRAATSIAAPARPICAWRASSVWMLCTIFSNMRSPTSWAIEARPTNCRLVKPVSNTKLVAMANSIGFEPSSSSSTRWRAGDRDPVVGVEEAVGPVELRVPAHQLVHQQQRDLRVAQLVERAEQRPWCARRCRGRSAPRAGCRPPRRTRPAAGWRACSLSALSQRGRASRSPRLARPRRAPRGPRPPSSCCSVTYSA